MMRAARRRGLGSARCTLRCVCAPAGVRAFVLSVLVLLAMPSAARESPTGPGRDPALTNLDIPTFADADVHLEMDGKLDEAIWSKVPAHDDLTVVEPDVLTEPKHRTQARYFYTERGMYIGVKMEQPPETLVARLSSRDALVNRDSWGITLDTSGSGLYGYWFTVNLGGSVMDGTIAPEREYSFEWDGPWSSASAALADGWSAELFLPWSMMAMPDVDGVRDMGFWTNRKVAYLNQRWSSPSLPFSAAQFMSNLGHMKFESVHATPQLDLYPYASVAWDAIEDEPDYRAGFDLFWRPSSNFQITATAFPDFGAVESDDVVVNLTAFETFFPDKRLFFLEGQEVFTTSPRSAVRRSSPSNSGARQTAQNFVVEPTTLVNTRRIGGAPRIVLPDGVTAAGEELGKPTDLLGAVKVTGQAGGLRYGLLTAFEDNVQRRGRQAGRTVHLQQDGREFAVTRLSYEAGGIDRTAIGYIGTLVRRPDSPDFLNAGGLSAPDGSAVVHGIDTHLLRGQGVYKWDTQLLTSSVNGARGVGAFTDLRYQPRRGLTHSLAIDYFDDEVDISDLGFIRRNDVIGVRYTYDVSESQGLRNLRKTNMQVIVSQDVNTDGRSVRSGVFLRNRWTFLDESELRTEVDFFPARWEDRNSQGNGEYKVDPRGFAEVSFGTDTSKPLSWSVVGRVQQEELGAVTWQGLVGITLKPDDRFSLDLDLDYAKRDGWLVHGAGRSFSTYDARDLRPSLAVDWFLSARQQVRLTLQWAGIDASEQQRFQVPPGDGTLTRVDRTGAARDFTISRLTAQLRYRWELDPLSDLFLVYTRGSNLPNLPDDGLNVLFVDALKDPVIDVFVMKLRYRFGR